MGDVAMTIPVLLALTQQHPDVKVTLVSKSFFKPLFASIPGVEFVSAHIHHQHKGIWGIYRLFRDLQKHKINFVADLHDVLRSKILRTLFRLSGVTVAVTDKGRSEKKALTRPQNKTFKPLKTMFERHLETFQRLGFTIDFSQAYFLPPKNMSNRVIAITGSKTNKWIGIAPFAHHDSKTYPFDLMQQLILETAQLPEVTLFLFGGGKEESELLERIAEKQPNIVSIAGKISFEHELELISNLNLMVSMDSGNGHLASLFNVPTITLWGATHPYAGFAPYRQPETYQILSDREKFPMLPTSAYGDKKVAGYEDAMRTILPETVLQKIQEILYI